MSSGIGKLVGTVAGSVIGGFVGAPQLGGFIGGAVGGQLFKGGGSKGQNIQQTGPRLQDLTVQTSTYGNPIPIFWGSVRAAGNVIWSTDRVETKHVETQTSGGGAAKGGGPPKSSATTTTFTYHASFAVNLCEGPILGVNKIWANKELVFDSENIPLGAKAPMEFRVYTGTETQMPDPLIESFIGVGDVPAYRGYAYVVHDTLQLAPFNNQIPNFTYEVITSGSQTIVSTLYSMDPIDMELDPVTGFIWASDQTANTVDVINPETMTVIKTIALEDQVAGLSYQPEFTVLDGSSFTTVPARMWGGYPFVSSGGISNQAIDVNSYTAVSHNLFSGSSWLGEVLMDTRMTPGTLLQEEPNMLIGATNGGTGFAPAGMLTDALLSGSRPSISWVADWVVGGEYIYLLDFTGKLFKLGAGPEYPVLTSIDHFSDDINNSLTYDPSEPALYAIGNSGSGTNIHKLDHETLAVLWERDLGGSTTRIEYHQGLGDIWAMTSDATAIFHKIDPSDGTSITSFASDFSGTNIKQMILYPNSSFAFVAKDGEGIRKIPLVPANTAGLVLLRDIVGDLLQRGGLTTADYVIDNLIDVVTGYAVTGRMSIRAAIEPLQQAFYFDLPESDYTLKSVVRGQIPRTLGKITVGSSSASSNANRKVVNQYTMDFSGNARSLFFHGNAAQPSDTIKGVIYSDVAGSPAAYLGETAEKVGIDLGWNEMEFAAPVFLPAGAYWIGIHFKNSSTMTRDSVTGADRWNADTYADGLSDPFDETQPISTSTREMSIYLTITSSDTVATEVTIPWDDLAARVAGAEAPDAVKIQRTQEVELPNHVDVTYIDQAAEYSQSTQIGRRLVTNSLDKNTLEVPIVMDADKAKQIADVLLHNAWVERETYTFTTTRKYLELDPADVITLTTKADGTTKAVRITRIDYQFPNLLTFEAVPEDLTIYSFSNSGVSDSIATQTIDTLAATNLVLMDVPMLRDQDNNAGFYAAAGGYLSGWSASELYRSQDQGQSFDFMELFTAEATIGYASTALADVASPWTWDRDNVLYVTVHSGDLTSSTEDNVLNLANAALLGNELIHFVDATETSQPNEYKLTTLLRGRRGTEDQTASHTVGERFVLLNSSTVKRIFDSTDDLNVLKLYRAVSIGQTLGQVPNKGFVNSGMGLEPYAPVHIEGTRYNGDITIVWKGRGRLSGGWQDSVDVPLSEDTLDYEVDVMTGATVVRTIAGLTTETVTYTAAQQVTDFGTAQASLDVRVYQKSALVGRGKVGATTI